MPVFSSWLNPKLEVRVSDTQGKGVFSNKIIAKDERLAIFGGKIMTIDEILTLPPQLQAYPLQIEERYVIQCHNAVEAEDTDFFNHSCSPNSGFKGQIFLVAMREIQAGEEITFDYAMTVSPSVGSDFTFKMDCECAAVNCRKIITEQDWTLPELQKRYRGYFSQYLQDRMK